MKTLRLLALLVFLASAVRHLDAQTYTFSTAVSFYSSGGIVVDAAGNFYVSSNNNYRIVKVAPNGTLTALAGDNYLQGTADGVGANARFGPVRGLALDAAGNLYASDSANQTIRKITPAGVVTTIAGLAGNIGFADGTGSNARFNGPEGIAVDVSGNLYVSDVNNHTIRKITPAGVVTTVAGLAGATPEPVDGTGSAARFFAPQGLAADAAGNLYVADTANHIIRKISPAGVVTTVAGSGGNRGNVDGTGKAARFNFPRGIAVDSAGNLFVGDTNNNSLRKVTPAGVVTTIGGMAGFGGDTNGSGANARFYSLAGIAVDTTGTLYIADTYSIRLGTPSSQPAITVQPQSQSVSAGSSIALTVTATGASPFTYQWQKNGTLITGATTATLAFPNVQAGDSATYTVTAANSISTVASSGAVLTVLAALPNNDFAKAQDLPAAASSVTGTNLGATSEANEPTHYSPAGTASSVWYKWTPTQSGRTVFSITSSTFAAVIAVYTGTSLDTLQRVAQNLSSVSFRSVAGTTYYVAVGSFDVPRGNFTLGWQTIPNDDFAAAQDLVGNAGSVSGSTVGATGEPGEPIHWSGSGTATSIWYRWTPTQSGTAVFDTIGSAFDTVLAAYTGSALNALNRVAQDNDSASQPGSFGASRIAFPVAAGTTYYLAIGSNSFGTGRSTLTFTITPAPVITAHPVGVTLPTGGSTNLGITAVSHLPVTYQWQRNGVAIPGATNFTLALNNVQSTDTGTYVAVVTSNGGTATSTAAAVVVLVPPTNDNFINARDLVGTSGTVTGSNVNATGEPGEPAHWNLSGAATSVWYRWVATGNGLAVIDTVGSAFDTVLAVYTGTTLGTLTRLTQDDDRGGGRTSQVSFGVSNGTTYYVAVGGNNTGARGNLTLNWQLSLTLAITTQPVNQTVAIGDSATFSVAASGTGASYQWLRNGTAIPGATTATLTVGSIQAGADASYTVTVTGSSGTVTSAPATLAVAAPSATTLSIRRVRDGANLLWSIAAGSGEIVTVGSLGVILSSSDNGVTWVPRESGSTGWLVAVTYGGGQFVIVGEAGLILTSPDGRTWTRVAASGTTERINNVIYADGKYVAVGEKGIVVTSSDGRVWTPRSTPVTTWLHGLAYHAGIRHFAACGEAGVFLYSSDAVTWNRLPVPGYTKALQHTVAVDSYASFVAVGEEGMLVSVNRNELVLKDGQPLVTWTAETHPTSTTAHLIGLVQGAGALFAAGEDGKIITATSDRGPWTTVASGTTDLLLAGMFYNDTLFVVGNRELVLQSGRLFGSRLINISTRGVVGTGGDLMISGFVVTGDRPKQVLIRAAGPTLASAFGLPGTLAAPVLTLVNNEGRTVATNTGWGTNTNAATIITTAARVGAFPLATGSADSALLTTLTPGAYTAQISGANNTTGVSIVEVYDTDILSNEGSRAINISTRGLVGTGANQMIAGFVIEGASARRVLIRASGPALAGFGVTGTLAEPKIELYNSRSFLHSTAGAWGLQPNADEIRGAAKTVSAFDLPDGSKDSAMVVTLLPGAWTVQVSGVNNTTGVALVEVYVLP